MSILSLEPPATQVGQKSWELSAIILVLVALVVPVVAAGIPPLLDYPNHLADLWLLTGGAELPVVSSMYAVTWDTLTNIGIDVAAVFLTPLFSYEVVGRFFVALAVLLPALGGGRALARDTWAHALVADFFRNTRLEYWAGVRVPEF